VTMTRKKKRGWRGETRNQQNVEATAGGGEGGKGPRKNCDGRATRLQKNQIDGKNLGGGRGNGGVWLKRVPEKRGLKREKENMRCCRVWANEGNASRKDAPGGERNKDSRPLRKGGCLGKKVSEGGGGHGQVRINRGIN